MRLFVFGTLKRGFPLHEIGLRDANYLGSYHTIEPYPLVIAGPWYAPMMLDEPGTGFCVKGELYDVPWECLPQLDTMEGVGQPGNLRVPIRVEPEEGGPVCAALAYLKDRSLASPMHTGYLETYQDHRFIPPERRSSSSNVAGRVPSFGGPDDMVFSVADALLRRHGADEAIKRARARRDYLQMEGQSEAAALWDEVAHVVRLISS